MKDTDKLQKATGHLDTKEFLEFFLKRFKGKIALASSLGVEDQVLTHMILCIDKEAEIFTLDTGRLPYESYDLLERTNKKYGINIRLFFPDYEDVQKYVSQNGINAFYESVKKRKECCRVRKTEPLRRALKDLDVWITGLRSSQSVTRSDIDRIEYDKTFGLVKINPLADWSHQDVLEYAKQNDIPVNELHFKGYPSIGCAPCTRAVKEGEGIREGRWWWEEARHKECGLHIKERA